MFDDMVTEAVPASRTRRGPARTVAGSSSCVVLGYHTACCPLRSSASFRYHVKIIILWAGNSRSVVIGMIAYTGAIVVELQPSAQYVLAQNNLMLSNNIHYHKYQCDQSARMPGAGCCLRGDHNACPTRATRGPRDAARILTFLPIPNMVCSKRTLRKVNSPYPYEWQLFQNWCKSL